MKITHEPNNEEAWVCVCGNEPQDWGFFPCNEQGEEVEPNHNWNGIYYICAQCKRIINQNTLEIKE